jgi:shikimate kinase
MKLGKKNIVLIGMPGVGKSTIGVLLAKELSRAFLDIDLLIQSQEGRRLRDIICEDGMDVFRAVEERHILALDCREHVIATGGSAVYSDVAMNHLRDHGVVVHLTLPIEILTTRITDLEVRGVVRAEGQDLRQLHEERFPLYARYRDCEVDCTDRSHEDVVIAIVEAIARIP